MQITPSGVIVASPCGYRPDMSPVRMRKRVWILPKILYATLSSSGWSWTLKLGPWSWNSRARRSRVDLPGPLSYDSGGSSRSTRTRRTRGGRESS